MRKNINHNSFSTRIAKLQDNICKKNLEGWNFQKFKQSEGGDEVCCDEVVVMRGAEVHGPRTHIFGSQKGLHTWEKNWKEDFLILRRRKKQDEDFFSTTFSCLPSRKISRLATCLEDVLKSSWNRLENFLEEILKTPWRRFEDVLKMSWERRNRYDLENLFLVNINKK